MTDDEYTIQETKDPFECLDHAVQEDLKRRKREEFGINKAFTEISSLGACSELMDSASNLVEDIFRLVLPGITPEEQKALYDRFEDLWDARRLQVKMAIRYAGRMYSVTKKEGSE